MTRAEINAHPSVAPALALWRAARAERDRILGDGRHSAQTCDAADLAARIAEKNYDACVALLMETSNV